MAAKTLTDSIRSVGSVVDPAYPDLDGNQNLLLNLLMLVATGMAEGVTLVGNGMGQGCPEDCARQMRRAKASKKSLGSRFSE